MSPPVFAKGEQRDAAYTQIKVPCFHMTGTEDDSPIGETKAADRRVIYETVSGVPQYLLTFQGGDHFIFSGRWAEQSGGTNDKLFQELIAQSSKAFWDAYLKEDETALNWLQNEFSTVLGDKGAFEKR